MPWDVNRHARSLAHLSRWQEGAASYRFEDRLDRTTLIANIAASSVAFRDLQEFTSDGCRFEIRVHVAGWSAQISGEPQGASSIEASDNLEEAFSDQQMSQAETSIANHDVEALIRLLGETSFEARFILINRPEESGFNWIRTAESLVSELQGPHWLGVLRRVTREEERLNLLVQDAGASWISTETGVIGGPSASLPQTPPQSTAAAPEDYRRAFLQGDNDLPSPVDIIPIRHLNLDEIERVLALLGFRLVWIWLAENTSRKESQTVVRFEGARVVEISLEAVIKTDPSDDLALWTWAVASNDPDRKQAIQQAASLAIINSDDLASAAGPVLRTAKSLLQIAKQGAIAEALSTRRSVKEGATTSAIRAGEAAVDASSKALGRLGAQVLAAGGVLAAEAKNVLSSGTARLLFALLLGLVAVTAALSFFVEFPRARRILLNFNKDLETYRDTLSHDDLESIKKMETLSRARKHVRRAWLLSIVLFLTAVVVIIYMSCWAGACLVEITLE